MDTTLSHQRDRTLLQNRDYTVIIAKTDDNQGAKPPGFEQRWAAVQEAVLALVNHCETFDPDGITIYVAHQCDERVCSFAKYQQVSSANLNQLIQANYPPGGICLEQVMQAALSDYLTRKAAGQTKANGEIIIVLLDGEPIDRMAMVRAIKEATLQMDNDAELGIGLVQIGEDAIARGFLTALDQHLQAVGAKFDIVTTRQLDRIAPDSLTEFLLDTLFG